MPRMTKSDVAAFLVSAIAAKHIWNVDYVEMKDTANRFLWSGNNEDEIDAFKTAERALRQKDGDIDARSDGYHDITYFPSDCHGVIGFAKKLDRLEKKLHQDELPVLAQSRAFVAAYMPLAELLRDVKPFIVKGRKPSADPTKTPSRTLDHTGTCPVCMKNIKLNEGKMVLHGYEVKWHQFVGNCFGVGHVPFEISPEGTQAYLNMINKILVRFEKDLVNKTNATEITYEKFTGWKKPTISISLEKGDEDFDRYKKIQIADIESKIGSVKYDIKNYMGLVEKWVQKPLPDGNRDHMEPK